MLVNISEILETQRRSKELPALQKQYGFFLKPSNHFEGIAGNVDDETAMLVAENYSDEIYKRRLRRYGYVR